ncbi:MAG: twin-arginine translocase subunit TatC [Candidatus Marinimicrobia bacterium CG_4_10_14_0_2_um_filter_48_9]|nr:MAG: twin-arginine translocase subunit TatC [Candidatus Marinimicrobia bacterium CG_4_10_14_0_2_um_filter_48_9]PJA54613.1 MAG: twin-arginine translocase subunit TatC [Candidatus Marinimicrobia bacterium CG_4_9_14_3_um_filter_48_9]
MIPTEDTGMPFLDHLEELRWRIIKALVSIIIFGVVGYIFSNEIIEILSLPIGQTDPPLQLLNTTILGVFMAKMKVAIMVGVIFSIPVLIYQTWQFIAPGLFDTEKRYVPTFIVATMICFVIGGTFSYYIMIPWSLKFFAILNHGMPGIINYVTIEDYLSYLVILLVFTGVAFELPVIVFILSRMGIVTPALMKTIRRYAYLVILILSAVFTPADPFTMMGVAAPMIILYEVSILISFLVHKRKRETRELEESEQSA